MKQSMRRKANPISPDEMRERFEDLGVAVHRVQVEVASERRENVWKALGYGLAAGYLVGLFVGRWTVT